MHWFRWACSGLLMLLGCLVASQAAHAASVVWVVCSDRSTQYEATVAAITAELENGGVARSEVVVAYLSDPGTIDPSVLNSGKLIITLGSEALAKTLVRDVRVPVLATLIPRGSFESLVKEPIRKPQAPVYALYLDQPFGRQLDLLHLALPHAKRVGVIWGNGSAGNQLALAASAQSRGMDLVVGRAAPDGSLAQGLRTITDDAQVLLAIADPSVFNSATLPNILLATYRAQIPVLAFSQAYVKAGALLSLYSTPEQIGFQAGALARSVLGGANLSHGQYLQEYTVGVNEHVARSLGLTLDAAQLSERLKRLERKP
ncbi:ABC transporter substrate-binding protein [Rhodoferax aquaticus]|nr:ABC transporter substrate binding protein [Rhodoferax aquaticus]